MLKLLKISLKEKSINNSKQEFISNFDIRILNLRLRERGYIALSFVFVIAAVILVIGVTTSLTSINELQTSFSGKKNEESIDAVEGCIEDALLRWNETDSVPSSITLPEGTCTLSVDSQSGNDMTFTVSGTFENHYKEIQVDATRNTSVSINSWLEQ